MKKLIITAAGLAIAGFSLTACGSSGGSSAPAAAQPTVTVTIPGPTVTVTAAPAPSPAPSTLSYSGYSDWNGPGFALTGGTVTVKFTYSDNSDSNFIADLNANDQGDDQSIANTIGTSGGETETLYPTEAAGSTYHLSITAQGNWTAKITQASS